MGNLERLPFSVFAPLLFSEMLPVYCHTADCQFDDKIALCFYHNVKVSFCSRVPYFLQPKK